MKRIQYPVNPGTKRNWPEVFAKPGSIELSTVETGKTTVPLWGMLDLNHPAAKALHNQNVQVPVFAHLVQHKAHGNYLIDCGLDTSFQRSPYGWLRKGLAQLFLGASTQAKGQDIATHLREIPVEIEAVFLTHLHFDHMAGTLELPKATRYIVGKNEPFLELVYGGTYARGVETVQEIDFSEAAAMPILGPCVDIFGDGALWAISTPGHSRGHMSFLVNAPAKPVLVAGDACSLADGFLKGIGPGRFSADRKQAQRSLDRLIEFVRQYPQVEVICGHQRMGKGASPQA